MTSPTDITPKIARARLGNAHLTPIPKHEREVRDYAAAYLDAEARVGRLTHILAVERGDESQAPGDWSYIIDPDGLDSVQWKSKWVILAFNPEVDKARPWHRFHAIRGGWINHPEDRFASALEGMEEPSVPTFKYKLLREAEDR